MKIKYKGNTKAVRGQGKKIPDLDTYDFDTSKYIILKSNVKRCSKCGKLKTVKKRRS